jgi:putative component of membrane protein insertase Oxa1/YidC/SpoIIIJ protein YidD
MIKKITFVLALLIIIALIGSCNAFGEKGLAPEAVPTAQFVDRTV